MPERYSMIDECTDSYRPERQGEGSLDIRITVPARFAKLWLVETDRAGYRRRRATNPGRDQARIAGAAECYLGGRRLDASTGLSGPHRRFAARETSAIEEYSGGGG